MRLVTLLPLLLGVAVAWALSGALKADSRDSAPRSDTWDAAREVVLPPVLQGLPGPPMAPKPAPESAAAERERAPWERNGEGDPLETGPCALDLELIDAATGEELWSSFSLWRLDVPANDRWVRGDQRQVETDDHPSLWNALKHVPEGRYRVHVHGARKGAPDPPSFLVRGERTHIRLFVDAPPLVQVELIVFDEYGQRLHEAESKAGYYGFSSEAPLIPDWVVRRTRMSDGSVWKVEEGASEGHGHGSPEKETASDGRFHVCDWRGTGRYEHRTVGRTYEFQGRADVHVDVDSDDLPTGPLVAIALPLTGLRTRVFFPDGTPLTIPGYRLDARCHAVPCKPGQEPWQVAAALATKVRVREGRLPRGHAEVTLADRRVVLLRAK